MYKVLCNKLTYGRRTYLKGSAVTNEIPEKVIKDLVKAKKLEPVKESKSSK